MTDINETVQKMLDVGLPDAHNDSYSTGFRDAIESMVLALEPVVGAGFILDAVETAMDAYANNYDDDFEDDGQPSEAQEWHDFDPDC